ncbi:hypothetical protein PF005_g7367 [Phytophthora fragariae]|uniref:F-box/LRR-repeat protein 15-like leucin rich repeat domain-containing protein n=1 Tax=Phytophthora fragariae TaxID=53985 RepID=A0A6A3YLD2_9STRA|nr:hypothetical protein PF005_g7367 [Phytophthora fragariae]
MVNDGTRRTKKRSLPLPLPLAPVAPRVSVNQEEATRTNVASNGNRTSSAKAHARNLAKLQMHLPREVVFFDPRLRVYHAHVNLGGWRVTDASLQQLQTPLLEKSSIQDSSQNGKNLVKSSFHTLTVDGSAHISVKGLRVMLEASAEGGGTLHVLRLAQCQLLSRGGGELLEGSSLPHSLKELDVSSCEWVDDRFLRTLTRHCSVLEQVSLARCRRVTDYGVAAFGESYSASLTYLDVSFCTKLTDTALLALLVGSSSTQVIPGGAPLAALSASARIRVLNAAGLPLVDGLTLLGLRGPCASRLESLDLSGCTVLRVAALERLARVRALTRLTKLDLSRCSLVDDQVLSALGMACPQLATLQLAFCSSITDVGIHRLVGETVVLSAVRTEDLHDEEVNAGQPPTMGDYEDLDGEDAAGSAAVPDIFHEQASSLYFKAAPNCAYSSWRATARATQIQKAYRAHIARVALRRMLFRGATALQKVYRGFCGRREAREIVLERAYAWPPRILILMVNSIYTRELAITWKRKRDAGMIIAVILQRRYRGFCGRREARLILARQRQRWYLEDTGARTIQHFFRSIIILVRLARFEALLCLRRRSATRIQATWRMWLAKALASARRLRNDRRRQHAATMDAISSKQQDRRLCLHRGAVHSLVVLYRASLTARGWQTPTYIRMLHRSATRIQALVRGHFGRVYAKWFRDELTRAAAMVQRVWRGKLGKKMWRALMEERQQLRRVQEEGDRAALIAQKQTAHHALEAFERETQHAVVLQRWFQTLKNRQIFREARELRAREAHTRAGDKVAVLLRLSTGSVVFQARVWRDCVDRKAELVALEEDECVAMEKEIEQLKEACLEAHAGSTQASRELVELTKRKSEFERSRTQRKRATETVKQRIQPFAMQAKQLTVESARESNANRQLQMELRRVRTELRKFHTNLRGRLVMEPLLLTGDVESLLAGLTGQDMSDNEDDTS